jgi:Uma2 family endonuclease
MRDMVDAKRAITAAELERMPEDGWRYELVRGVLRRMSPAGYHHGRIALRIGGSLGQHVDDAALGAAYGAETGFRLEENTVRAPDAAFVRTDRLPRPSGPGFFPGAPDLAVEVISPTDTYSQVHEKVLDWLDAGTRMVLVVDPDCRVVTVYHARDDVRVLTEGESIDGGGVVPGWRLPLAELFATHE